MPEVCELIKFAQSHDPSLIDLVETLCKVYI